jgi:putative transcriptional regulator
MPSDSAPINLTHHFLIAMPGLEDEAFRRSVVYVCEHSERGALGLVINKPSDINLKNLFDKVELPLRRADLPMPPCSRAARCRPSAALCCTSPFSPRADRPRDESVYASTMTIPGGLEMTTSKDVLEALSTGAGPRKVLVSLGYSAWGEGQLESELGENSWLTVDADLASSSTRRSSSATTRPCCCWALRPGCCRRGGARMSTLAAQCRACVPRPGFQTFLALDFGLKRTGWRSATACCAPPSRAAP